MNSRMVEALLSTKVQLGANMSAAAGPNQTTGLTYNNLNVVLDSAPSDDARCCGS
jgi:hypothetical protein